MGNNAGLVNDNLLRFLQINLHHSIEASRVFNETQKSDDIHVGLITEPYLFNRRIKIITGGDLIYDTTAPKNMYFY